MKTIITTCSIQLKHNDNTYLNNCLKLINTYLKYTDFDILVLTNNVDFFNDVKNERVILCDYNEKFNENIISNKRFNMHLKRYPIMLGSNMDYDVIYHHDCDCYIDGWDNTSYLDLIEQDYDVFFPTKPRPQLGGLRNSYKHFQDKIDREFIGLYYDDLDNSPNPAETRIIFKNNDKLKIFLNFWDKISNNNKDYLTYYCGVYFGTSAQHAKMKMGEVTSRIKFSEYCKISHGGNILNYFGHRIIE
jgi:hypothetical protein